MTGDYEPYVTKARESIAGARSELESGRYNNAANRAYYGAYQAAITALMRAGFSNVTWGHYEVQALFSGQLVRRRKLYPAALLGVLNKLSEMRIRADYGRAMISRSDAQGMLRDALEFVTLVLGAQNA